jgi:ferredoxin
MANRKRAVSDNVPGSFFVDDTCIDCDTCRQVAPLTFAAMDGYSAVHCQPDAPETLAAAAQAIICCPTASIGSDQPKLVKLAQDAFPQALSEQVWYCGWTSQDSLGASSYLVHQGEQWWLIDSQRWTPALVTGIER